MGKGQAGTESFLQTTLADARQYLNSQLEQGKAAKCPCCTQLAKVYSRKIYSTMAQSLITLWRLTEVGWNGDGYYHISEIEIHRKSGGGGDFAKLAYWGLVEEKPKDVKINDQRTSGFWKITTLGKAFVQDRLKVAEYIDIYNGKPLRMRGNPIGIQDALGDKFNYKELMEGTWQKNKVNSSTSPKKEKSGNEQSSHPIF